MKKHFKILIVFFFTILSLSLNAKNNSFYLSDNSIDTLSLNVYFHNGSSVIDPSFKNNGNNLESFVYNINNVLSDTSAVIHSILIETGASPEGSVELNERLAMDRARSLRKYIIDNLALSPSQVKAYATGIDWEGLTVLVRGSGCKWEDSILSVISNTNVRLEYNPQTEEKCKRLLQNIDNGKAWNWMKDNLFEHLRQGSGSVRCIISRINPIDSGHQKDTIVIFHEYEHIVGIDEASVNRIIDERSKKPYGFKNDSLFRKAVFAFKTNLLVPLMNIGIEVPMGNRCSLELMYYSPWVFRTWMNYAFPYYQNCFQVQALQLCTRIWLGKIHNKTANPKYRLLGHSIGIGLGGAIYDIGFDYKGQQGNIAAFGLDYMYTLPLGKKGGVRMEFCIGVCGYYNYMRNYTVQITRDKETGEPISATLFGDGDWQHTFGVAPFKANVNLVIPIFQKKEEQK